MPLECEVRLQLPPADQGLGLDELGLSVASYFSKKNVVPPSVSRSLGLEGGKLCGVSGKSAVWAPTWSRSWSLWLGQRPDLKVNYVPLCRLLWMLSSLLVTATEIDSGAALEQSADLIFPSVEASESLDESLFFHFSMTTPVLPVGKNNEFRPPEGLIATPRNFKGKLFFFVCIWWTKCIMFDEWIHSVSPVSQTDSCNRNMMTFSRNKTDRFMYVQCRRFEILMIASRFMTATGVHCICSQASA